MAAPGNSPIAIAFEGINGAGAIPTSVLLAGMLRASEKVSDLIFSPGRPPQVEIHGQLTPVEIAGSGMLSADDTRRIAADLIGTNKQAINTLREQGSCDVSYGLPGMARFRVNVFIQRGSCAIVMRVIPTVIPTLGSLRLPAQLEEATKVRNGIILVTGGTGSGKSSTLAALIDRINSEHCYHVLTVEDPIEFLHRHKKSTVAPARVAQRRAEFHPGAAGRAATGSARDYDRRNPRPRDAGDSAGGRGKWPSRSIQHEHRR